MYVWCLTRAWRIYCTHRRLSAGSTTKLYCFLKATVSSLLYFYRFKKVKSCLLRLFCLVLYSGNFHLEISRMLCLGLQHRFLNFLENSQDWPHRWKLPSILVALRVHFMLVLGELVKDQGTRNALEYSARSPNSAGQEEEFCFSESTTVSRVVVFRFHMENTVQKMWMLVSRWKDFFSLLGRSKLASGSPASCWRAAEPWWERTALVNYPPVHRNLQRHQPLLPNISKRLQWDKVSRSGADLKWGQVVSSLVLYAEQFQVLNSGMHVRT